MGLIHEKCDYSHHIEAVLVCAIVFFETTDESGLFLNGGSVPYDGAKSPCNWGSEPVMWNNDNEQRTLYPLWKTNALSSQHSNHAPALLCPRFRAAL